MKKDIICMIRNDGKTDIFLVDEGRMPENPFEDLKQFFADRQYESGYFLYEHSVETYEAIKARWETYNRSLMGLWESPRFAEYYEEAKRYSSFLFDVPRWCQAELKQ